MKKNFSMVEAKYLCGDFIKTEQKASTIGAQDSRSVVHERFSNEEFANLGQFDR